MSTTTKERVAKFIKNPLDNGLTRGEQMELAISHVGSKNALDVIVAFIKSNRNPTLKDYKEVSERLFQDNCQSLSSHVIEYLNQIGDELEELRSTQDTAPPAPMLPEEMPKGLAGQIVSLLAHNIGDKLLAQKIWNACRAAMLQGAEPVTRQSDGVSSGQDDPPTRGWVVTHDGKDYFYREQPDAVTHMNAALESGRGVSLRALHAEPVIQRDEFPDCWVLVPIEPTPEMLEAGDEQFGTYDVYRRMIAAAPQQEVSNGN